MSMPWFVLPCFVKKFSGILGVNSTSSDSSLASRNTASAGATWASELRAQFGVGELICIEIEHVEKRFWR